MYVRKRKCSHYLGITLLIKSMISVFIFLVITTLIRLKFSIAANAIRNDVITMYDIIKFCIEIVYWMV